MNRQTGVTGFYEVNNLDRPLKLNIIAKFQDHALAHKRRIKRHKWSAMGRGDFCKPTFKRGFFELYSLRQRGNRHTYWYSAFFRSRRVVAAVYNDDCIRTVDNEFRPLGRSRYVRNAVKIKASARQAVKICILPSLCSGRWKSLRFKLPNGIRPSIRKPSTR